MSSHYVRTLFVLFFWTASMFWLSWTHLRPAAGPENAPKQGDFLPLKVTERSPVHWSISLDDERIGWVRQEIERLKNGRGTVISRVHFEDLSVQRVVRRGLGNIASLAARRLASAPATITLTIDNVMRFDHFGQLTGFRSDVTERTWGKCIRLRGTVLDKQLVVKAYLSFAADSFDGQEPIQEFRLPLPTDMVVADSLAPRPRYTHLHVGQTWLLETYNPLFPTRPMETVRARVIGKESLQWAGDWVRTYHVVYERADDAGLSLETHLGDIWVDRDGVVLRQTIRWGSVQLTFDRLSSDPPPTIEPLPIDKTAGPSSNEQATQKWQIRWAAQRAFEENTRRPLQLRLEWLAECRT